jgi:hypothetical protein
MTSALEKLRAIARSTSAPYEINEKNEITPQGAPAEGLISFNSFLSLHGDENTGKARAEHAAIVDHDRGTPRTWAEGFAALCTMAPPTGFSPARWQRIVDAAGNFIDKKWAARAIECGWSDLDVFGCDPDRPDARFDCMGLALLLDHFEITGIDEHGADLVATQTGARQRYRLRPLPAATVSLWALLTPRPAA